ncbi:hypothetical protein MD484_g797, partial [Candolleomyces efflorescens]
MSILLKSEAGHRYISTSLNASNLRAIPAWNAPEIRRGPLSNGGSSAVPSTNGPIDDAGRKIAREEPSFITNGASYVNRQTHWIDAAQGNERLAKRIAKHLVELGVVNVWFKLNDPSNLVNLDPMLHSAMNKFAMIAVTPSLESLDELTRLLIGENQVWQQLLDRGTDYIRLFSVMRSAFENTTYELIILHPTHFLPRQTVLPVYSETDGTPTLYQVAPDGVLRQSPATVESPRLPPFSFNSRYRGGKFDSLNPLLVAMAAQIKFRRYERSGWPPLEEHTRLLMDRTAALVAAIYWKPALRVHSTTRISHATQSGETDELAAGAGDSTRSSRSKDVPLEDEGSDSSDYDEITMDQMMDMMSGPNGEMLSLAAAR